MGHTRLGAIPKTRRFAELVGYIDSGGGGGPAPLASEANEIAKRTLLAAQAGLTKALNDKGLCYCFYMMTQIVLAAREVDWRQRLERLGIQLSDKSTLVDITCEIQGAVDDYLRDHGRPTDISEIAQRSLGNSLSSLLSEKTTSLFDQGPAELQHAVYSLSTKDGFSRFGQKFFGDFLSGYLNFFLSRVTPNRVGSSRLGQLGDLSQFDEALRLHCDQSAGIVRDFCGTWYSKTEFKEGISLDNTSRFMAVAMKKLASEINIQRERE